MRVAGTFSPTVSRAEYPAGAMVGNSARYRTSVADGGPDPPRPVSLAPEHRRRIAGLDASLGIGEAAPSGWLPSPRSLSAGGVRRLVIGAWGANYYAPSGSAMFTTLDRDFFLPSDPGSLLAAWRVCEANGFGLFAGMGPLDAPRDDRLARAAVEGRALTRASNGAGTDMDLSLLMSGFDFEEE